MSRSFHTQKLSIRAARRIDRPHGTRSDDGSIISGRIRPEPERSGAGRMPRLVWQRPAKGFRQPLTIRDVREWLEKAPIENRYRLRSIRLMAQPLSSPTRVVFGEYLRPGEIRIFPVPDSTWRLSFRPADEELLRFRAYGAKVTESPVDVTIEWPAESLRRYMLVEVLAHELGHHCLLHDRGRKTAVRRRDHELRAELHARRAAGRA